MPKFILYLFFMLLLLPTTALANSVNISVTGNEDGSSNSVKYNSNTSTNYQSSGTSKNETHIKINDNGEVKEYHGSGEDVHLQSSSGKTTVKVDNNSVTNNPSPASSSKVTSKTNITVNSTTAQSPSPSAGTEASVAGVFKDDSGKSSQNAGLWEIFKKKIESFFSFFS